jgi:hypothetical protein
MSDKIRPNHLARKAILYVVAERGRLVRRSFPGAICSGAATRLGAGKQAITSRWSNGPIEGQINQLKMIKRPMYGRARLRTFEGSGTAVGSGEF